MVCLINLTLGMSNAGSSSFINFWKDSDCVMFKGWVSKIIQLINKLQSSIWRDSLCGVTFNSWDSEG